VTVRRVGLVDVAPRDGLQSEEPVVDTATKVELISRLVDAGIRRVEAVSFAHPRVVPQMADAEAVMAALPRDDETSYVGLVLNEHGVDRAIETSVDEVNAVVVATDTFSRRNQNMTTAAAVVSWHEIAVRAADAGLPASVTVAAAFGCPYEGEVAVSRVVDLVFSLVTAGPSEIALADTIGVAVPSDVVERVGAVRQVVGALPLRCHFHNTRNTGIANAYAALEAGVDALDASVGGIGGCPFAPRAVGNIPTEDLVYMLDRLGVETGVSLERLIATSEWLAGRLGHPVPGLLSRSGPFPGGPP
jgi:hydroxymethylglutaryl-CoA lyase